MYLGLWKLELWTVNSNWRHASTAKQKLTLQEMQQKNVIGSTNKVKNTWNNKSTIFYFHLTHILEISRFEVLISRFFWAFFQSLQICMFWRLAGLLCSHLCFVFLPSQEWDQNSGDLVLWLNIHTCPKGNLLFCKKKKKIVLCVRKLQSEWTCLTNVCIFVNFWF